MNRRDMFSFLAAAPVGVAATVKELSEEQKRPDVEVRLPANLPARAVVTVVNVGDRYVIIR